MTHTHLFDEIDPLTIMAGKGMRFEGVMDEAQLELDLLVVLSVLNCVVDKLFGKEKKDHLYY